MNCENLMKERARLESALRNMTNSELLEYTLYKIDTAISTPLETELFCRIERGEFE